MKKIFSFLDLKFYSANYISLIALILSIIFVKVFNLVEIYENSLLENTQTLVLIIAFIACFFSKKYKKLFYFGAIVLFLMIMRELSYGRVIFCQIPNSHDFYSWSHYKYGFLAHIIVGIYIASGILYGIINKIWVYAIDLLKNAKFPLWTFLGCVFCTVIQILSEKYLHNTIIEETSELMLYCFILAFILIYLKKEN